MTGTLASDADGEGCDVAGGVVGADVGVAGRGVGVADNGVGVAEATVGTGDVEDVGNLPALQAAPTTATTSAAAHGFCLERIDI
jgi:hypothetical protein